MPEKLPTPATRDFTDLPYGRHLDPRTEVPQRDDDIDCVIWEGADFANLRINGVRFHETVVAGSTINGATGAQSRWHDVWLGRSRLIALDLSESDWRDVDVIGCSIAGLTLPTATLRRVRFTECKIDTMNLRGATLRGVVFDNCELVDLDLGDADVRTATFVGCTITRLRVNHTRLTDVDLRGATSLDVTGEVESLRGATIDTGQLMDLAPALAAGLGIAVTG